VIAATRPQGRPKSTPTSPTPAHQPDQPDKPKTLWEKVITATPVILTVVATVLAGLSSSEMTRAQYYRSLAAQHQSKVSDQWNLFQAKRIRGTSLEVTIPVLRSATGAGPVTAESLQATAARLPDEVARAEKQGDALLKAVEAGGSYGPAGDGLRQAAERFLAAAKAAQASRGKLGATLAATDARRPLAYLAGGSLPDRVERSADERQALEEELKAIDPDVRKSLGYFDPDLLKDLQALNPEIPRALAQVNARKTERQMADTLKKISEEQIQDAIDDGEAKAAEYDEVSKPASKVYRALDAQIAEQAGLARGVYRAAQDVNLAAAALPPISGDARDAERLAGVRAAAAAVVQTGDRVKAAADQLSNDFKGAQLAFDARRYEREARYNQAVAGLYELDVRKASLQSERHVTRSKNFFYAMLAAQAGVTIATFALAVRYRSTLWLLAFVAGLAALAAAVYVYLKM
jgi:hypothetical protein